MPNFRYKAIDRAGKLVRSTAAAFSEADLELNLEQKGLVLIKARASEAGVASKLSIKPRVAPLALIEFYRRLSQTLELGLSLLNGLEENARYLPSKYLRKIAEEIKISVESGQTLHDAMGSHSRVFDKLDLAVVRMGEETGVLPQCLKNLAAYREWLADIRTVLKKAAIYPIFVLTAIGAVIGVWIGYVLPQLVTMLAEMGVTLPDITMRVLAISVFLQANWIECGMGLILASILVVALKKTEQGSYLFHKHLLKVPLIGPLIHKIALARLCHNFATMYRSGIMINNIFEILSNYALGNRFLEERLQVAFGEIEKGESMAGSMEIAGGFPSLLLGALRNGETTGTLDDTFERLGHYFDGEVKRAVQSLVSAVEPISIFLLGGVFGLIALSILLPLYDVIGEFGSAY